MKKNFKELEKRVKEIEKREKDEERDTKKQGKGRDDEMEKRLRKVEKWEREKRRKNVLIKELEVKEMKRKEAVEEIDRSRVKNRGGIKDSR